MADNLKDEANPQRRAVVATLGGALLVTQPIWAQSDFDAGRVDQATRVFSEIGPLSGSPLEGLTQFEVVRSPLDFAIYTVAHIERVKRLGLVAHALFREFSVLNREMVIDFLSLHDGAKINFTEEFRARFGVGTAEHPFYRLLMAYGQSREAQPELSGLIDEINQIDFQVSRNFFRERGLISSSGDLGREALLLLDLERLADSVDTAISRGEEFGRAPVSAVQWLRQSNRPHLAERAEKVEQMYSSLVADLSFSRLRSQVLTLIGQSSLCRRFLAPDAE